MGYANFARRRGCAPCGDEHNGAMSTGATVRSSGPARRRTLFWAAMGAALAIGELAVSPSTG